MAKIVFPLRLDGETVLLLQAEAERRTRELHAAGESHLAKIGPTQVAREIIEQYLSSRERSVSGVREANPRRTKKEARGRQ